MRLGWLGPLGILLVLGGCASSQQTQQQVAMDANSGQQAVRARDVNFDVAERVELDTGDERDPFETANRKFWYFNWDILDKYLVRPVTVLYVDIAPQPVRTGLLNASLNLEEPGNAMNNLLQGKVNESFISAGRFVVNSTVGLLGTIDVAAQMGMAREEEEFGETMGVYGVGTGPYLMLPFLGPNDSRNLVGDVVDSSLFPLDQLTFWVALFRTGIEAVETRAALIEQEQQLETSLDPYALVREVYIQNQEFQVRDGNVKPSDEELELDDELDDFLDDL